MLAFEDACARQITSRMFVDSSGFGAEPRQYTRQSVHILKPNRGPQSYPIPPRVGQSRTARWLAWLFNHSSRGLFQSQWQEQNARDQGDEIDD